jgi:hypothetical protein
MTKKKKNFEYLCAFSKNFYDFLVIDFYVFSVTSSACWLQV